MLTVYDVADLANTTVKGLEFVADRLSKGIYYDIFRIPKKHGGVREIIIPAVTLSSITTNLHRGFVANLPYTPPEHVHGFVKGRSAITNAAAHLDRECVLRVDLEDFFPSISREGVFGALRTQGMDTAAADIASRLTTINGRLPLGLSTSPYISNLAFTQTDVALSTYATAEGLIHTRYADDLTFSGTITDRHLTDVESILLNNGWKMNERKTAFMRRGGPQYVTGLYVGCSDHPRVPRAIKRQMRWLTHIITKFGYATYMQDFGGKAEGMTPARILGWIHYITSVEPNLGRQLQEALKEELSTGYVAYVVRNLEAMGAPDTSSFDPA